ncbi:MAG: hypothetical protein AB1505_26260 [Candidatus Latescibacterota bacterium]
MTAFLRAQVFATLAEVAAAVRMPSRGRSGRRVLGLLEGLTASRRAVAGNVEGIGSGWWAAGDQSLPACRPASLVRVLHLADPLVRGQGPALAARFSGRQVLRYLLIDGEVCGAACGRWRIRPHDVEDVVVNLPEGECARRRDEVLAALGRIYRAPDSRILRYAGRAL